MATWCEDAAISTKNHWDYLYVRQNDWDKLDKTPNSFREIISYFKGL